MEWRTKESKTAWITWRLEDIPGICDKQEVYMEIENEGCIKALCEVLREKITEQWRKINDK